MRDSKIKRELAKILFYFVLFLAALGLCCCVQVFSSCGKQGLLFIKACRFLIVVPFLLWSTGSRLAGFSSSSIQAQYLWLSGLVGLMESWPHEMWKGEGNGTPLQYSCLENPMDGGDR